MTLFRKLIASVAFATAAIAIASESDVKNVITGNAAFTTYKTEKPGTYRKITVSDLPQPGKGVANPSHLIPMPQSAWPKAPEGFKVERYAEMSDAPRELRTAPNGDLFTSDSDSGKAEVFRGITKDGKPEQHEVFATGLKQNFGIAFYPLGKNPEWIYLANTNSVIRYHYHNGDLKATGQPETVIAELPSGGGHITRDLAFSPDGKHLFVSVGSASNVDNPDTHPAEKQRADILEFTP